MDRMYTAEEMIESDMQSFRKGIEGGLEGALIAMKTLEKGIRIHELTHEEAWNTAIVVLTKKIKEVKKENANDRDMPVLRADADSRS